MNKGRLIALRQIPERLHAIGQMHDKPREHSGRKSELEPLQQQCAQARYNKGPSQTGFKAAYGRTACVLKCLTEQCAQQQRPHWKYKRVWIIDPVQYRLQHDNREQKKPGP